jgi:hypothetical protein
MKRIKEFLMPDWRRLTLFSAFLLIAVGGKIQAWAFSDIPPKPPLYDFLRPLPTWPLWMLLLLPLALFAQALTLFGIDLLGGPGRLFIAGSIIYFYLLACILIGFVDWLIARHEKSQGRIGR